VTKIGRVRAEVRKKIQESLLTSLRDALPDERILEICREEFSKLRGRVLVPLAMVWYCVAAALSREKSFAAVWHDLWMPVSVAYPKVTGWRPHETGVLSRARRRIKASAFRKLWKSVGVQSLAEGLQRWGWRSFRMKIWDGTTVCMPDEEALRTKFGKASNQHGEGAFPNARWVNLLDEGTWTVLDSAWGSYRTSEQELAWRTLESLESGDLLLADRLFASAETQAKVRARGAHYIMRKNQTLEITKHPHRRIGWNEWLVTLSIPSKARKANPSLPKTIEVRVIKRMMGHGKKREVLWLVTSLLDRKEYPAQELAELYFLRWGIETSFRELKQDLHLEMLRSKTVEGVGQEMEAHLLAYNLLRLMIMRAAKQEGVELKRISFLNAVRIVSRMSECMRAARLERLPSMYRTMLKEIAASRNPKRPGRREPRALRRSRVAFPALKTTRAEWRVSA